MRELCRRTNKEYTKYCLAYSLFQSPSSVWRTTTTFWTAVENNRFQSTSSVWRTTVNQAVKVPLFLISIHVLRVEDDQVVDGVEHVVRISIHVLRVEDDEMPSTSVGTISYFNPRPPCGGRPSFLAFIILALSISIHVLRVEDDEVVTCPVKMDINFNPRPPCGGRLDVFAHFRTGPHHFNPRPPCGGRHAATCLAFFAVDFNPRPPCGGRPVMLNTPPPFPPFQSTSSVWRTTLFVGGAFRADLFQSTSSVWRTTIPLGADAGADEISIHVLRVEDDRLSGRQDKTHKNFNPRPPCGG